MCVFFLAKSSYRDEIDFFSLKKGKVPFFSFIKNIVSIQTGDAEEEEKEGENFPSALTLFSICFFKSKPTYVDIYKSCKITI